MPPKRMAKKPKPAAVRQKSPTPPPPEPSAENHHSTAIPLRSAIAEYNVQFRVMFEHAKLSENIEICSQNSVPPADFDWLKYEIACNQLADSYAQEKGFKSCLYSNDCSILPPNGVKKNRLENCPAYRYQWI
jgi:hypothetical protein